MTDIKSIPSMSKAELVKEVERLATLVRTQSAATTELGNLSDMQQARIGELEKALRGIAEHKGRCIYSLGQEFREGSNAAFEEMAHIANEALAATEPRP